MFAIFVSIKVKPGYMDRFIEATFDDARGSVQNEPGCCRFDVLKDDSDPNLVHLYEVYEDRAAVETHRTMLHYLKWRSTVQDWFDGDAQRVESTTAFPSDDGWRRQKQHLPD